MPLSRQDVDKVALLARLSLTESEAEAMTEQLGRIVGYVDQLSEVDTEGVEPMAQAVDGANVLKPDEVRESLPREKALASAPRHNGAGYLVPAVLGD